MATVRAVVFDAYGTLLDFAGAAERAGDALGERWRTLSDLWRRKQLEYTWLRSLMRRHVDFWQVTGESLDHALEALGIRDPALRQRLMDLYLRLDAYPDVRPALEALRGRGLRLAVLSNGSPGMLDAAIRHARLDALLDDVLSVEEVGTYKPSPEVYALAARSLDLLPGEIAFVSANGWDAHGAGAFGFRVAWCNRAGLPRERLPGAPEIELRSLGELPAFVER
jgi:2-haloacid dehalogenase